MTVPKKPLASAPKSRSVHAATPVQRGFSLLEVLLFVAILSGLTLTGYLQWRARETVQTARAEHAALAQADRALITFATIHHRLPCPDSDRDGLENCSPSVQNGWLPSATLQLAGIDAGVTPGQLRYLVQRGTTDIDLAVRTDVWRPLDYKEAGTTFDAMRATTANSGTYAADILTLADLCQRLDAGARATLTSEMAQVASTPARAVGYALAHPGLADVDGVAGGSMFDGDNALTGNTFADPARASVLSGYDDRVLARSFASLQTDFACDTLLQSVNTIALGVDVVEQVDGMRLDNITSATRAVAFAGLGAVFTATDLAGSITEAVSDSGNAVADGVLCGATLGLAANACVAIGLHVGAAIAAGVSTVAYIATIVLNVAAAGQAGKALALADASASDSNKNEACKKTELSPDLLKQLLDERTSARSALTTAETNLANKRTELATAVTARDNAVITLRAAVRGNKDKSDLDPQVATLLKAADDWDTDTTTYTEASQQATDLRASYDSQVKQVARYDAMIADRVERLEQVNKDIAELEPRVAAETDAKKKETLLKELNLMKGEARLLDDPAALQVERDRAAAKRDKLLIDRDTAIAAETTANTAVTTSLSAYASAYAALRDASPGPYVITASDGTTFSGCTRATWVGSPCVINAIATQSSILSAMADLYGSGGNVGTSRPQENSKFMKPKKLKLEELNLANKEAEARKRAVKAGESYDAMLALSSNPPSCNVTGTGVTPWSPAMADGLLRQSDIKGATR